MDFQGRYVEVHGTRLYVYEVGDAHAPALLYLHGGPGMGCHEFVHWQGRALASGLRVIAFDQRGFHHSDPIPEIAEGEPLSESLLVEDCEALREALGVRSWFVLGHSYGGRLAVRYAARYPESVRGVIFENPAWSVESTERFRLPILASVYERNGRAEEARACRELAANPAAAVYDSRRIRLIGGLAELGEVWYLHDHSDADLLDGVGLERLHPEADGEAAGLLSGGPEIAEDLLPLLAELTVPALLIVGEADLATSPDQIEAFVAVFGAEGVERVGSAGHFVQGEQPEIYARLVLAFAAV